MLVVVTPTIKSRQPVYDEFIRSWAELFRKHNVLFVTVWDGDNQHIEDSNGAKMTTEQIMGKDSDLIAVRDGSCKNLGLVYALKHTDCTEVLILDDDVRPIGDTIQDHLDILRQPVATSWLSTASEYMRGFPYGIRNEAVVALSHGVWEGVPDFDAPTQLIKGVHDVYFPKIIVPKGVLFPMCGMNVAVIREALPYLYFAPPWNEMARCDDIFGGINLKRDFDKIGLAVATGFARVRHDRASNVFSNLHREGLFIKLNETYYQGDTSHPYFDEYHSKLKRWHNVMFD